MVAYDCNADTTARMARVAKHLQRKYNLPMFLPEYVPCEAGFLRDPNAYQDDWGNIEREMDRIIREVRRNSETLGALPQLIILFLGFGGHAKLDGYRITKVITY